MNDPKFTVTYLLTLPAGADPAARAREIAEEQTVELPHGQIPERLFREGIVGAVTDVTPAGRGAFRARIAYRFDAAGPSIPQFLNVLFGNVSLKRGIAVIGLDLPDRLPADFPGPRWGKEGLRRALGVYGRPLVSTALKPLGLASAELARLAGECARGGIDIVKDDHGLADQRFHPFEERVGRVTEALAAAEAATGRKTLYFPNLCLPAGRIEPAVRFAVRQGVRGVLVSPQLSGFDLVRHLAVEHGLMIMAHPAFTGSLFANQRHGISPAVMLGSLFRLFGADISIFPSWGGRFPLSRAQCLAVAQALVREHPSLKPALPAPAGGLRIETLASTVRAYGEEAVLLVGGALLGRSEDRRAGTAALMEEVRRLFPGSSERPATETASACELGAPDDDDGARGAVLENAEFFWKGRPRKGYKPQDSAGFSGVSRTDLAGGRGTDAAFELRYFEIEPGGYSSLERHDHEHVIIGARGTGVLVRGGERATIRPHDVARVGPFQPHQLRNEGEAPFGFYCIVDRERDRPQALPE